MFHDNGDTWVEYRRYGQGSEISRVVFGNSRYDMIVMPWEMTAAIKGKARRVREEPEENEEGESEETHWRRSGDPEWSEEERTRMLHDTQPRFRFSRPRVQFEGTGATELSEAEQISKGSEHSENESLNLEPEITDFVRLPDTDHATSSALNTCRRHPDSGLNTCRPDQFLTHPNTDPTTRIRARILIRRSVFRHHHGEPQCRRPAAGPILSME